MIAYITKGCDFRGATRYAMGLTGKDAAAKRAEVVGGNAAGGGFEGAAGAFRAVAKLRPDIKRPVWHCSLSFPPGEHPDNDKLAKIAEDFMEGMGFPEDCPYIVTRHHDKPHTHIHVIVSRIGLDGRVWKDSHDVHKAIRVSRELEAKHGLREIRGPSGRPDRTRPKFQERQMEARKDEAAPRVRLQELIDDVMTTGPTAVELCEYLEVNGVEVRANLARTGRLNGFSFSVDGIAFKGSSLGRAYSWAGLAERGASYDPARDMDGLSRFSAGTMPAASGGSDASGGAARIPSTPAVFPVTAPPDERLRRLISAAAAGGPTAPEFCRRLEAAGVTPLANMAGAGRLHGFSFVIDGHAVKGSDLGKAYGWGRLKESGVSYDPARDWEGMAGYAVGAVKRTAGGEQAPPEPPRPPLSLRLEALAPPKDRLRKLVLTAAAGGPTAPEFCRRLEAAGVQVLANVAGTGRLNGLTFTIDGVAFKGSSLGKAYSWGGLRKQGVTYEPGRDGKRLERFTTDVAGGGQPAAPSSVDRAWLATAMDEAAMADGRQRDDAWARGREADRERAEDDYRKERKGDEDKRRRTSAMMEAAEREAAEWERERRKERRALEAMIEEKLERAWEVKGIFVIGGFFAQDDHGRVADVPEWCYDKYDVRFSPTTGWAYIYQTGDDGGSSLLAAMSPSSVVMYKEDDESLLAGLEICRSRWSGRAIMLLGSAAFKSRVKGLAAEYFPEMEFTSWPWPWRWPWRWGRGEKSPKAQPAGPEAGVPGPGPEARVPGPGPEARVPGPGPEAKVPRPGPEAKVPRRKPRARAPKPRPRN